MKRNIFLWASYDFANSIIMIVFLFYFSQWLVVDSNKPDWWFNVTLVVSSAIFLILAPYLANKLDKNRKKLKGLRISSVIFTILFILTALSAIYLPEYVIISLILYTLAMSAYLISFIYYTPMINDLSDRTNIGTVSGIGQGANYIGQIFGLIVSIPFASGALYLFGSHGRVQTFLPAIILFIICSLPLLIYYKEPDTFENNSLVNDDGLWMNIKRIFSIKNLSLIFIAYFLFSDALLTFSNNFPIYLEKVFGVSDTVKSYLAVCILTSSVIGSVVFGKISDKKGSKKTLVFLLISWVVIFTLVAITRSFIMITVISIVAGLLFGPVWALSRAMVAERTPREIEASSFGFYILAERFATFIGPLVWSLVLASTASMGSVSYSYAIVSLAVLVFISIFFLARVKNTTIK